MKPNIRLFIYGILSILLHGCATVEDIKRSTDIIRSDNELIRLLQEVRPNDMSGASTYLIGLGIHSKTEADNLKHDPSKQTESLSYYRIAAISFWRSGDGKYVNDLFAISNSAEKICSELKEKAPDRDCLFLQLVIPFAGIESSANNTDIEYAANKNNLSGIIDKINFNDDNKISNMINTMKAAYDALQAEKKLIKKILAIGEDHRFISHKDMQEYYCHNVTKARNIYYKNIASVFSTKTNEYYQKYHNSNLLGFTLEDARALKFNDAEEDEKLPVFCPQ